MRKPRSLALAIALVVVLGGISALLVVRWRNPQPIPYRGGAVPPAASAPQNAGLAAKATAEELRAAVKGSNVIICIMDAARADHFSAYGYPRETTPNFDRLSREAVLFDQHFCQYSQTSPSTATLFTGQYPDTHGVAVPRTKNPHEQLQGLQPDAFTIDWVLGNAGFTTYLFTSTPASAPVLRLGASFQTLITPMGQVHSKEDDALWRSPEHLLQFITSDLRADSRFFAYVHFLPPHNPYEMPQKLKDMFKGPAPSYWQAEPAYTKVYGRFHDQDPPAAGSDWVNLYDANLRWSDWALGELVDHLKRIGAYDNTLLIVTADHGEALGEHKYQWHATCPYDEAIHIPLLVKFPNRKGPTGRVDALTETVDIFPTILDLYGISWPPSTIQGKSLVRLLSGEADRAHDYTFARTNGEWPCYVVRDRQWALLLYQGGTMRALYDLTADPRQTHNVIREKPQQAAGLLKVFTTFAQTQKYLPLDFVDPKFKPLTAPGSPDTAMTEETRRKLRTLGYMD